MKYIYLFYKRELVLSVSFFLLLAWALVASYLAVQNKTHILVISSENGELRALGSEGLDAQKNIEENFVRRFLLLSYNFDLNSYQSNTERASDLMSESLFNHLKQQLKTNLEELKRKPASQSAEVFKCERPANKEYECDLIVWNMKEGADHQRKMRVMLKIKKAVRTVENPWGFEVDTFEVKKI